MLIKPLPGTNRDHLIKTLSAERDKVANLHGPFHGPAYGRLVGYLRWASQASRTLRHIVSPADISRLVLTDRYAALLAGASSGLAGSHQEAFLHDLISLELEERVADFDDALSDLRDVTSRWNQFGVLVVADSSVYIQHPSKLLEWDFHDLCQVREESVHLLFPMVVVDELDGIKQTKERERRWRAGYTLAVLEKHLSNGVGAAVIRPVDLSPMDTGATPSAAVTAEVLYDPPGHGRLPINDDEIVDRALSVQLLAGRPVLLLTYDTGQAMRGRSAGLKVRKLRPEVETEPEPSTKK